MDTELLVENRIEDGQKLIAELVRSGFDVTVAFWVRTSEENLWFLYIGSTSVDPARIGDAYRNLYTSLSRIPDPWVSMSEVKLVPPSNPIARDAIAVRDRYPGKVPTTYHGKRLGNLTIEEAYIYPKPGKWFKGFDEIKERFPSAEAFSIKVPYPGSAASAGDFIHGFAPYMGKVNASEFEGKAPGTVLFMGPEVSGNQSVAELVFVYRPEGWNTFFHVTSGAVQAGFRPEVQPVVPTGTPSYQSADFSQFAAKKLPS